MKRLGKKLKVGALFESTSNAMTREELWAKKGATIKHHRKLYRKGDKDYFMKGKRQYYCEVHGISQTTTGVYCWLDIANPGMKPGPRWWKFTYVVKVIEN